MISVSHRARALRRRRCCLAFVGGGLGPGHLILVVLHVRDLHVVLEVGLARRHVVALRADHARVPPVVVAHTRPAIVAVPALFARNPQLDETRPSRIFVGPSRNFVGLSPIIPPLFALGDLDLAGVEEGGGRLRVSLADVRHEVAVVRVGAGAVLASILADVVVPRLQSVGNEIQNSDFNRL